MGLCYLRGMNKKHFESAAKRIRAMREEARRYRNGGLTGGEDRALGFERDAKAIEDFFIDLAVEHSEKFNAARFHAACQAEGK
jgi:hypothetical protein